MSSQYRFHYDTQANASFLVATLEEGTLFVQYEMKMLENNRIGELLPARKYVQDGAVCICYNVTGRMSLSQALNNGKIRKEELITLLTAIANTCAELADFQLPGKGMLLDEAYLFVRPGSYVPGIIYLPICAEDDGLDNLRSFVRRMVLESRVADTGDNFVQKLLDTVNSPQLTIERLQEQLKAMSGPSAAPRPLAPEPPVFEPIRVAAPAETPAAPAVPTAPAAPLPGKKSANGKKKEKKAKEKQSSPRSVLFTAVQALLVLALAAALKARLFTTADDTLNVRYLLGAAIIAASLDTVLYRELFVNRKSAVEKPQKQKKGKEKKQKAPKQSGAKPPLPSRPGAAPVTPPAPAAAAPAVPEKAETPAAYSQPIPAAASRVPVPTVTTAQAADGGEMKTVLLDEGDACGGCCLEYYENGLAMRIHLKDGTTRIGSRAQSVDYALPSHKVSKVHAEFLRQDGHCYVQDINSTNGTYLNDDPQRIVSNQYIALKNGDRIRLADTELTLKC